MSELIDELERLLFDWELDSLDSEGIERVREILRSDSGAREFFLQQQTLNAALRLEGQTGLSGPSHTVDSPASPHATPTLNSTQTISPLPSSKTEARSRNWGWLAAAAVMLIAALAGRIAYLEWHDESSNSVVDSDPALIDPAEEVSHGVAIITQLVDVEWTNPLSPREVGDSLSPGEFAIQSGFAQVEFLCGATVIVEGPAQLDLKSATLAKVMSGRLRAQVPPAARGFALEVDDMKVVDLGTEFGLSVSNTGANVQVFDGEVELQEQSKAKRLMVAGESLVMTSAGQYEPADITPKQFVDIAELTARAQGQQDQRYLRWQEWSSNLRSDDRLIAYYAFDQAGNWQRKLNSSLEPARKELDGAIVGANRVPGRWDAKSGLEFRRPGDRVRVQIPGEFESLTFSCWVKIDSLDRRFSSLFLTDHYDAGEPHWQILHTGQLYFSVRPGLLNQTPIRDFKALSPPFWNSSLSGRWIHLASVYSVEEKLITHYLNGNLLSEHQVPPQKVVPTQIGIASIGNWASPTQADAGFAIRNLNGSMDELVIFCVALTETQVRKIYEIGKP